MTPTGTARPVASQTDASAVRDGSTAREAAPTGKPPLTVLIAHNPIARAGIRMALDTEVCAEASSGQEAIRAAKREQPDLCLVGRELCGDRLRVVQAICRAAPRAAVVILAEDRDIDDFLDSICAGAVGYVPEAVDAERLRLVVRAIAAREAVVPRSMVLELVLQLQRSRDGLTARECQVCALLRRGHTTSEIARRLDISSITVRRHISALVHKLGVEDRAALTSPGTEPPRSLIAVTPFRCMVDGRDGRDAYF